MKRLLLSICLVSALGAYAQDTQPASQELPKNSDNSKFLVSGFGFAGFTTADKEISTFGPTGFDPIFLWKKSDRLFFESELLMEFTDNELKFNVEYATLHYKLCKYLEFGAGKFLSPFGIFNERIHPSWINKFADNPLGFNHDIGSLVGPMSEIGLEFRGGAQLGQSKVNYAAYVSNGPNLVTTDPMMAGMLMYENINDNNNNKAVGGRIGFLPFANSSLEFGVSAQVARAGDQNDVLYQNIGAQLMAFDLSYAHKLDFIKSNIDIKAQFNMVNVDKAVKYPTDTTMMNMDSTFDNKSQAFFIQLALRPAYVDNNFFKNVELAFRYSSMSLPADAMWGGEFTQATIGLNYWLSWHSVLKFDYQMNNKPGAETINAFMVQWGFGF